MRMIGEMLVKFVVNEEVDGGEGEEFDAAGIRAIAEGVVDQVSAMLGARGSELADFSMWGKIVAVGVDRLDEHGRVDNGPMDSAQIREAIRRAGLTVSEE